MRIPTITQSPTSAAARRLSWLLLFVIILLAAGASAGAGTAAHRATASVAASTATAPKPYTKRQWTQLVARAKREGSVTIYSTQIPTLLADMAAAFEKKYGIKVDVNRQVDQVLQVQINAGFSSGKVQADLWVANSLPYVLGSLKNKWVADARGPAFFAKGFDRKTFARPGKAWIPSAAIIGYAWNTQQHPRDLTSFRDILDPALEGRLGVLRPGSPAATDYWYWIRETFGRDFIERMAALKPKIYVSAVPMQGSLGAGEIAVGSFIGATVKDLIAQGAPIKFKVPANGWNAPYYAMILGRAPHPAAAQLLANYMVSREGQAVVSKNSGAVLKGVPDTTFVKPRIVKLKDLTPQKVAEFQSYWDSLFH